MYRETTRSATSSSKRHSREASRPTTNDTHARDASQSAGRDGGLQSVEGRDDGIDFEIAIGVALPSALDVETGDLPTAPGAAVTKQFPRDGPLHWNIDVEVVRTPRVAAGQGEQGTHKNVPQNNAASLKGGWGVQRHTTPRSNQRGVYVCMMRKRRKAPWTACYIAHVTNDWRLHTLHLHHVVSGAMANEPEFDGEQG